MGKLFGTDGIRGVVNAGLDAPLAYQVGLAAAAVLRQEKNGGRPVVTIGKDTRISSDLLEGALVAGLCSAGADVLHLGVFPTPAVAFATVDKAADAGVVISASHNPFEHNGIKIFNGKGFKLSDVLENRIEDIILNHEEVPLMTHGDLGRVTYLDANERERYLDHLVSTIDSDLAGLRIAVDCANGASSATAPYLFARFPQLQCDVFCAEPDGVNINNGCGSTHLEALREKMRTGKYDLGLAFDGDADRFLAVDEQGKPIDGDQIMAICGSDLMARGELPGNAVVATVMSNLGFRLFTQEHGMKLEITDVGDRNVLERMVEKGYTLGGEQSGHTIFLQFATTGDGQLSALQLLQVLKKSGKKASELAAMCKVYPQVLINVPVADKAAKEKIMASPALADAVARTEEALAGKGRVLVRPSGTESLVRVMVEATDNAQARTAAESLVNLIKNL